MIEDENAKRMKEKHLEDFMKVVTNGLQFCAQYTKKTGFSPNGMAVYFVTRNGERLAGPYAKAGAKGKGKAKGKAAKLMQQQAQKAQEKKEKDWSPPALGRPNLDQLS